MPVISGTVSELGTPVARTVRAYRRDTGALIGETVSAADGTFSIDTSGYTGECYVIALDDNAGVDYNAKVFDRIVPV